MGSVILVVSPWICSDISAVKEPLFTAAILVLLCATISAALKSVTAAELGELPPEGAAVLPQPAVTKRRSPKTMDETAHVDRCL